METLQTVQPVGMNMDFIRDYPQLLVVEAGFMSGSDTITLEDGTPLIKIERDLLSAKHRIHFVDAATDLKLFEMVKERFTYQYYAEHPTDSGTKLFEIDIESAFMAGPTVTINFSNVVNGGMETQFVYKVHTFDKTSTILWDGLPVAEVDREGIRKQCSIRLAAHVDPLPIIAMLMALTDRARKRKNGRGRIGGSGNFYTASSGTAAFQGFALGAAGT